MSRMKEDAEPLPPSKGDTRTAQGENQAPRARTPSERDESADSQGADNASARRLGRIAHDGVVQGQQDTSKGPELDATYQRVSDGRKGS